MKSGSCFLLALVLSFFVSEISAYAHHSVAAEFNTHKWVSVNGTVTKVEWTNPHTFFYVDAKDAKTGMTFSWACELGSPNMLMARGWKPNTLKVGMNISVSGTLARDGSRKINARNVIADGIQLTPWPSEVNNP